MADAIYPRYGADRRMDFIVQGPGDVTITATSTIGSNGLSATSSLAGVAIGGTVTGPDIPSGSVVIEADDTTHSLTMSIASSGAHTAATFTISNPAAGAALQGKTIHLYDSTFSPSTETTLADLVAAEVTFTGWTPPAGVWDDGLVTPTDQAMAESQLIVVRPSTTLVTPVSIGGLWVDDGTGVIEIWPLNAAVVLADSTDVLKVLLTDTYPTPGQVIQVLP